MGWLAAARPTVVRTPPETAAGTPQEYRARQMVVDTDLARVVLPKNFLRPCLLLLLHESPAHGYELRERLRPLGFNRDDPGRLYRALRSLEEAELVRSAWQSSAGGPDRRTYELTPAGEERLLEAVAELQAMHEVLDRFLLRCADTASPDGPHRAPYGPG